MFGLCAYVRQILLISLLDDLFSAKLQAKVNLTILLISHSLVIDLQNNLVIIL
jgi:hypothetical protein